MYNPVTCSLLPDPFFHESLLTAEELHGKLVIRRLEKCLQLVFKEALLNFLARKTRAKFLLRGSIKGDIVHPEVDFTAAFVIHLVTCKTKPQNVTLFSVSGRSKPECHIINKKQFIIESIYGHLHRKCYFCLKKRISTFFSHILHVS